MVVLQTLTFTISKFNTRHLFLFTPRKKPLKNESQGLFLIYRIFGLAFLRNFIASPRGIFKGHLELQ
jgi:hypothetical protein